MATGIDHLVIGAATLDEGAAYVRETLGVEMPLGGVHTSMGTHNLLMQLGNNIFLEVIAVNPAGGPVSQPRWYGLDDPYIRARIKMRPALLTWVVNTDNLAAILKQSDFDYGVATPVTRGHLNWLFGLPQDGRLLAAGMLPYLIEWQTDVHPSVNMADRGCTLNSLELRHPNPHWLGARLENISANQLVTVTDAGPTDGPVLSAQINTPDGPRTLCSYGE